MDKKTSYQEYLLESLKDPQEAISYLKSAIEEGGKDAFLLALNNVMKAQSLFLLETEDNKGSEFFFI